MVPGRQSGPHVNEFVFDDDNEEKFAVHGVTPRQVHQVLQNDWIIFRNRRARRAAYLLIGTDSSGRCIAVPIERTHNQGLWRPVTAWYCKPSEESRLR